MTLTQCKEFVVMHEFIRIYDVSVVLSGAVCLVQVHSYITHLSCPATIYGFENNGPFHTEQLLCVKTRGNPLVSFLSGHVYCIISLVLLQYYLLITLKFCILRQHSSLLCPIIRYKIIQILG